MVNCSNVGKCYSNGATEFWALKNIDLSIHPGEFVSIVGRSGSGKSTLLHLLGGLDDVSSGDISVNGQQISRYSKNQLAAYRNRAVGFVFQDFHLEGSYTASENVELPLLLSGLSNIERKDRIREILNLVGMLHKEKTMVKHLSGGEKQRIGIARALANNAPLLLADEPCGNLDVENSQKIMRLFRQLSERQTTVVLVTHNLEDAKIADRIVRISDGEIES